MIDALIFDVDGTLVDSVSLHAKAWQDAFLRYGKSIDFQEIRNQIGKGGDEILPAYLSSKEIQSFGDELKEYRGEHFKKTYISSIRAFPHVRELFEKIKSEGKKIALGSSAHKEELEHYISLANIGDLVDIKTSADDADKSKPHPDIFEAALTKLGTYATNTIVVGDSPYDAEAASRAHIESIGFLCGGFDSNWLLEAGFIALYDGPQDLLTNYWRSPLAGPRANV